MQKVRLGRLANNRPGLFTNGFLAMPLTEEQFTHIYEMDWEQAKAFVKTRWEFELIGDLH